MTARHLILLTTASVTISISGCGTDGIVHRRPQYDYQAQPGDPVFFLESTFGTQTEFKAKIESVRADDDCLGTERVAYMQRMDAALRRDDVPGPWTISAPANKPILIAGQRLRYTSDQYDFRSKVTRSTPPLSCPWVAKIMTPQTGAKYKVRLSSSIEDWVCVLSITQLDGKPVETMDAPNCASPGASWSGGN
jgi:hypothetical protein